METWLRLVTFHRASPISRLTKIDAGKCIVRTNKRLDYRRLDLRKIRLPVNERKERNVKIGAEENTLNQ